ncbi:MAG: T9SS type A sorting domain-containing protein [Bacteroidetes bacterium]|nr:T9SS type A sorting domain-containing protein [Bacteroidota bacterium]
MKHFKIVFALVILLFGNHCFAQWGWNSISMNPTQRMQSMNFLTEDIGYAMMTADQTGAKTLEKTTDGGFIWTAIPLPVVGQEFQSLHFHADGAGVVVFRNLQDPVTPTRIYQTLDDGMNWQDISPDTTATGMGNAVCQFLDQDTGFFSTDQFLYATVDGGTNWTTHTFNVYPMSISFYDSQNGTIGTFDGTFNYFGGMLTTTNGGQTWTQTDLTGNGTVIGAVGQLSPTIAFAAPVQFGAYSQHQFYRTTNNGATWDTLQVPNTLPNSELKALDFKDELNGVAAVTEIGGVSYFYETTDGGNNWTYFDSLPGLSINDLQLIGNTGYLAGGELGVFYRLTLGMSVENAHSNSLHVYPNPAISGQTIRFEGMEDFKELTLMDLSGKAIYQSTVEGNALDLPSLPSGIYFLRMDGIEGSKCAKLIVE